MVKIIPRIFTGEADNNGVVEDPRTWLMHFEKVCRPNGWNEDADKLQVFMVFLEGEAGDWYDVNSEWVANDQRTWEQVKAAFTTCFQPVNYADEIEE